VINPCYITYIYLIYLLITEGLKINRVMGNDHVIILEYGAVANRPQITQGAEEKN
jgi:hypothetical protein